MAPQLPRQIWTPPAPTTSQRHFLRFFSLVLNKKHFSLVLNKKQIIDCPLSNKSEKASSLWILWISPTHPVAGARAQSRSICFISPCRASTWGSRGWCPLNSSKRVVPMLRQTLFPWEKTWPTSRWASSKDDFLNTV